MRRVAWQSLLTLLLGLGIGLLYAWVVSPIRYVDTTPNTLRADFKDQFRASIAASYSATHNLGRAKARLALLGDANPIEALTAQAQRMLASGESFDLVQEIAGLATDLGSGSSSVSFSVSPSATAASTASLPARTPAATLTATASPSAAGTSELQTAETPTTETIATTVVFDTPTSRPTRTPIPTASAPFELLSQDPVCNPNLTDGLLQISVLDSHRHQMPGVEITISWSGGEESFFTGLKPEIADGYADYVMQAGVIYAIRIASSGTPVAGLSAPACPDSNGQTYLGGLKLVFRQP